MDVDYYIFGPLQVQQGLWHRASNLETSKFEKAKNLYLRSQSVIKCPISVGKKSERQQFYCQLCNLSC